MFLINLHNFVSVSSSDDIVKSLTSTILLTPPVDCLLCPAPVNYCCRSIGGEVLVVHIVFLKCFGLDVNTMCNTCICFMIWAEKSTKQLHSMQSHKCGHSLGILQTAISCIYIGLKQILLWGTCRVKSGARWFVHLHSHIQHSMCDRGYRLVKEGGVTSLSTGFISHILLLKSV